MKENELHKKYLIYPFNFWCIVFQILLANFIPVILLSKHIESTVLFLTIITFINIVIWYLTREFLLFPKEIVLVNNTITVRHLSINKLKIKRTATASFDKISHFSGEIGGDLKFKLIFTDGHSFSLYKNLLWNKKDDFQKLIEHFEVLINDYNKEQLKQVNAVTKRRINFGDKTYLYNALWFFCFSVVLFIQMIGSLDDDEFNYMALVGFLVLVGLGLNFLFIHRKIKKNK